MEAAFFSSLVIERSAAERSSTGFEDLVMSTSPSSCKRLRNSSVFPLRRMKEYLVIFSIIAAFLHYFFRLFLSVALLDDLG